MHDLLAGNAGPAVQGGQKSANTLCLNCRHRSAIRFRTNLLNDG
jgi:hypothetical protein